MSKEQFFAEGKRWRAAVADFQKSHAGKSTWQLLNSIVPFIFLWVLMYQSLEWGYWITLLLAIPAAGFSVRLFIIQHDCGHGSFFGSRKINDRVGILCSLFTFTPYQYWKLNHNIHHANAGNLDQRGIGDIYTMTVQEYLGLSKWGRFKYRVYRNPLVLFMIIPTLLFLVLYRFPTVRAKVLKPSYPSIYYTDAMLGVIFLALGWWLGFVNLLMIQLPVIMIAATAGVWLFYVQHQFEETYWAESDNWDFASAAIEGSSYYKLPKILQWFTGNIGFHHIHHLSPKIPNYNLEKCHKKNPLFHSAPTLTLWSSLKSIRLALWDEGQRKLVSFRYLKNFRPEME